MKSQRGFTLIEIIIALVLLSFVSLFTAEAIQRALKTKTKVQGDIDKYSTVRDALRIMERDINMAFSYHDIYIDLYNQAQDERLKRSQTPATGNNNAAAAGLSNVNAGTSTDPAQFAHKTEKIYTQFLGENDKLDFTSLSNVRMMEESPISAQAEIGYRLKPCRRRSNQEQSSNCLWRRVANYLHDDITTDGQETVLLENVIDLKFRYLGPGKAEEWTTIWLTNERGDDLTKGKFPYAVEITLAVKDATSKAKDKELRMTMVAAIRNPNNPKDIPKDATTATPTPGTK